MTTLLVLSHPVRDSLTGQVANRIAELITTAGNHASIADLHTEGFDPRFTAADHAAFHDRELIPADVAHEQSRIEQADALVLIFPVYWWSAPAMLKGWIDRVFTNGWAYHEGSKAGQVTALTNKSIHLVLTAGADEATYAKYGVTPAMETILHRGVFAYCSSQVASTHLLYESDGPGSAALDQIATEVAKAIGGTLADH